MPRKPATSLSAVLKDAESKHDLPVGPLDSTLRPVDVIPTGNVAVDYITRIGGFPRGRSIELSGFQASGKTTAATMSAVEAQRMGSRIVYLDYEQAFDPSYAAALGLDTSRDSFLFAQPDSLEQGMDVAKKLIATGEIGMVIFDSVAAMVPGVLIDAETGKQTVAVQARMLSQALQTLNPVLREHNTAAMFVNHLKERIGAGPGPVQRTTPGGMALKYYASMRVEFTDVGKIRADRRDPTTGTDVKAAVASKVRVKVTKNKNGTPFGETTTLLRYGSGFSDSWSALQVLTADGTVRRGASGYFFFPDRLAPAEASRSETKGAYVRGEMAVCAVADTDPDFTRALTRAARESLASGSVDLSGGVAQGGIGDDADNADDADDGDAVGGDGTDGEDLSGLDGLPDSGGSRGRRASFA